MEQKLHNTNSARQVLDKLKTVYPSAGAELKFSSDFELLVAVILSAQCTDKRVNEVTSTLFQSYNTPQHFAEVMPEVLEKLIYSCGFYRAKSKNIISASKDIIERFNSSVPSTLEELMSLSGVGRKTANVVLSVAFKKEAFAVDTHVFRVSNRLGFSKGKTPNEVESDVTALLKHKDLSLAHHLLIFHGRYCCHSQKPNCASCAVSGECLYFLQK